MPGKRKLIYFDYAASTPIAAEVLALMQRFSAPEYSYNPSAQYLPARMAKGQLEESRTDIAAELGAKPSEIVFTAGATEANNLALQGVIRKFPDGELVVSAIEHDSVMAPARKLGAKLAPVLPNATVDITKLAETISGKTVLVSVMLVNNAVGSIQPIREIAELVQSERRRRLKLGDQRPIYLHSDAAQAPNTVDIHVGRLGVDLVTLNGEKMYGPRQSGILFVKAGTQIEPLLYGGGQEFGVRSGTENLPAAAGLALALKSASQKRNTEIKRLQTLRRLFEAGLAESLPSVQICAGSKHSVPHILTVLFPGYDNERLMMQLEERGIICGIGSACSASADTPSQTLQAIGMSDEDARSTLRFSFGRQTTEEEIKYLVDSLKEILDA